MIAVTGGNGLLGSFIIRELIKSGQPFVALKRNNSDVSLLEDVQDKITWRDADVLDPVALQEMLHDATHVIHAAAIVSYNPRMEKAIYNVNVLGTRNIVNACLSNRIKRFLHVSSVAALGRQKDQTFIDEENKWIESPLNSTYAKSKYLAELEVFRAQEEGLSTLIVNPSIILAPADWHKSSAQLFKYVYDENKFYIDGSLNYIDVRDAAAIIRKLLFSAHEESRFILNAGAVSFKDFFENVSRRLNKRAPSIKVGKGFLKTLAALEAIRSAVMNSNPLITRETARLSGTQFNYDNKKIRKTLDFEFELIDETLQWCCEHYIKKINHKK
jgi:dihydroflavonol-4-reductase